MPAGTRAEMRFEDAVCHGASMLEAAIFVNIWRYGNSEFVPAGPAAQMPSGPRVCGLRECRKNMDPEPLFMEFDNRFSLWNIMFPI